MDRTIRNKKSKSRNARTYDRSNQSLLGKVASKVKGILYPSWLSTWMSSGDDQGRSLEEESADEEEVPQPSNRPSKRPRLRLHDHSPSILSAGTQTWIDGPSTSSIFNQSRIPSTVTSSTLVQETEPSVILNGDDHSENSEESASTSGCSSLVSHKDKLSCMGSRPRESELTNFRGQLRDVIGLNTRQSVTSQNESLSVNVGSSRMSLWSGSGNCSPNTSLLSRSPSVIQRNQPGFNVSSFVGPKLNQSTDSRTSSPFYKGKTTFGGASALRRMPISVAPYQVDDKSMRSQVKVNSKQNDSSLEGMSAAAKRILMSLEKMSSPVTDARKIPNTNKSPVDLSLYLMPPKHRGHTIPTPTGTSKGPPIANISTISKMATLKNCGHRRFHNTSLESIPVPAEDKSTSNQSIQDSTIFGTSKSGGGKMRNQLTRQHQSAAGLEELECTSLPNVPLPISLSSLPTFNFGPKLSQGDSKMNNNFQFSNPIVVCPRQSATPRLADSFDKPAQLNPTSIGKASESTGFTFSQPIIELESPFTVPLATINSGNLPQTWECSSCWSRNPDKEPNCLACETPKTSQVSTPAAVASSSSIWKCDSCWIQNPASMSKCQACEAPKPGSSSLISTFKSSSSGFGSTFSVPSTSWVCDCCCITNPSDQARCLACEASKPGASNSSVAGALSTKSTVVNAPSSMWNCGECWVPNPAEKDKCMACEAPNPSKKDLSTGSSSYAPIKTSGNTSSPFLSGSAGFSSTSTPASGFAMPVPHNGPQAVSFGGFKIPTTKPSDSEEAKDRSSGEKVPDSNQSSKVTASKKSSRSTFKFTEDSSCENESETLSDANGLNNLLSANQQSSENLLDSSKEKTNGTFSFKSGMSQSSQSAFNSKANAGFSTPGGWECDTCLVRVTGNAQICPACETHRPTKKNTSVSGLKDPGVFKFSSPIQNSPLAFKLGAPTTVSSLSETTTATSSSFTFSTPISTNSPFSSATPASTTVLKSSTESKSLASEVPAAKPSVPEFKFDAPKLPSTDAKTIIPVINLEDKTESSSSDTKEATDLKPVSQSTTSSSVTFAFGASKSLDTTSIASAANFSAPSENTLSKFPVSQANTSANPLLTVQDVKKLAGNDSTSGQSSFLTGNFNFKVPSTSTPAATLFSKPAETAPDNQQQGSAPKVSEAFEDKKSISPFGLSSTTPSLAASPFGQSLTGSAPVFDIRESATPKTSAEPLALKSSFVMSTTSSSQPTISFGGSSTSAAASTSQPTASGLLAFQPTASKNEDSKAPSAPTFALSATGTPSTFSFGNQAAPLPPGGFSFFSAASSTATATTASSSGVFTFGSTASQASKPGGFTFKSSTEEKPNPVSSSSMSFGVPPTTTTASSAIFKFGASAPSSAGGFVFGAVKSEPTTTASSGFQFGSGSAPTTNTSVFSGFQPTQPAAAPASVFQFGAQPSSNPGPALNFGSTNTFAFGAKAEAPSLMPQQPAGAAAPAGGFGATTMQPMFGSTPSGGFGKTEKTGFNFAAAASGPAPVFQFGGNVEKKPSAQFAFGATSQEAANPNNSFAATPFNMSSTPSFNFGAGPSAGAQPFQFAASTAETGSSAAPRKIRKALRRVPNRHN